MARRKFAAKIRQAVSLEPAPIDGYREVMEGLNRLM
jgi:hypothetical protein